MTEKQEEICQDPICGHERSYHRSTKHDLRGEGACVHVSKCPCKKFISLREKQAQEILKMEFLKKK